MSILCDQAIPPNDKVKKLMLTFYEKKKKNYIPSHTKILLRKRIQIKKNTLCNVQQSNFMKFWFISLNNENRTECSINKDKICVELFKFMSNSNFGKQNVRKYKDTRIANNEDKAKKIATKVTFNECHILWECFTW